MHADRGWIAAGASPAKLETYWKSDVSLSLKNTASPTRNAGYPTTELVAPAKVAICILVGPDRMSSLSSVPRTCSSYTSGDVRAHMVGEAMYNYIGMH